MSGKLAGVLALGGVLLTAADPAELIVAAHRNDLAGVERLLAAHADAKAANPYGVTALLEAAAHGNARMVERLLRAGADANQATPEGQTALMAAARSGNAEAVQLLLRAGAPVDARETWKGQTALMWAAAANRADAVKALIAAGADVNARSTAWLDKVKKQEDGNLVSNPPKGGLTPLLYAARQGSMEAARVLVQAGADLNLTEPDGTSPLVMAILNAHYDLAGMLLGAGADPNVADRWGRGALYAAVDLHTLEPSVTRPSPKTSDKLTAYDVAKLALEHGAKVDAELKEPTPGRGVSDNPDPILRAGATPFLRAAKTGDVETMRLLVKYGANPKAVTAKGVSALMAAAGMGWRYGDSEVAEEDGLAAVKVCLELGLDIAARNDAGRTALHGAAERGGAAIAEYLAQHGALLDVKDKDGMTPLDIAKGDGGRGHPEYPEAVAMLTKLAAMKAEAKAGQ